GQTYHAMERYDEALADFNRAIEISPEYVWAITNRGETYRDMERYDEALADFNRAIEIRPTNTWPITSRGETYRLMERWDDARRDIELALAINPELLHANFEAAILVSALEGLKQAKHEWEKLAQLLKNATGLSPIDRGAALFITSSALAEWDRADELLNSLTNDNRRGRLIAELSKLLKELAKYSDVNTGSRLNAYCTQIESFGNNNTHP
ncbi:tetratricopeptide repeat protein, partial [Streptomyces sp. ME01-24h]|nr:tetratricopeptide repeat protein [Streptomyces sp. ME01-24h]